jgi:hypothetical protein
MHDYIIESMVTALKPVLKNPAKGKQILERFWSDKMALVWDVHIPTVVGHPFRFISDSHSNSKRTPVPIDIGQ